MTQPAIVRLALTAALLTAAAAPVGAGQPPALVTITIDTTAAPDMAGFAARCKAAGEAYYPTIAKLLPTDGYTPPAAVTLTFKPMDGVAYTQNTAITCAQPYFSTHPKDVGAVIHELTHVVQHYTTGDRPGWLVEGIADWVRWFNWEPANRRPHADPARAKYDASYQTTAQFLDWAQAKYNPRLVALLNNDCRKGHYRERMWQTYTGHTLQDLGAEWKASLRAGGK